MDMRILPANKARANLYRLIDEVTATHQPIMITGKRSHVVIVGFED